MIKRFTHFEYRKAWMISGLLAVCMLWVSGPIAAQSQRDVGNRLNRIENEINTLSRAVYKGEISPSLGGRGGAVQANTEVRMQQLERELRDIRGMLEEQSHAVRQMRGELDRTLSDMALRLSDLEGGSASGSRGLSSLSSNNARAPYIPPKAAPRVARAPTPVTANAPAPSSEFNWNSSANRPTGQQLGTISPAGADRAASLYENAFAQLKNAQYGAAEKEFQAFVNQYPDHVLTSNAKYWLGETFYVRGSYERAARLFAEGYKKYPAGAKAPDNLLKLGMSLNGLGNTQDACVAFAQLQKEFSGKSQPVLRRAKQEMTRIGCT